ncbi:MAG: ABC transporter permease [Spirochaetes bacterium]|jgi:ABC-type lipoprotein release transport system permease subunit|nr:ABC transporter permease [Spirochaetota bacterium]
MNLRIIGAIAFRNIFRDKKRTYSLGITYAIVTIILLALFSFTNGVVFNFGNNLAKSFVGHLNIFGETKIDGKVYSFIDNADDLENKIRNVLSSKVEIYPRVSMFARIYNKGYSKASSIVGVDLNREKETLKSQIKIVEGSFDDFLSDNSSILLPKEFADYFEFKVKDQFIVSTKTVYGAYNTATFTVAAIYESINPFSQATSYAHFDYIRTVMLMPENSTSQFLIYTDSIKGSDAKRDILLSYLGSNSNMMVEKPTIKREEASFMVGGGKSKEMFVSNPQYKYHLTIFTLEEILSAMNQMINSIRLFAIIIASIMLAVIAISLYVNIRMTINEQMKEIGTMRTIGLGSNGVVILYVFENIFLCLIFTVAGIIFGLFLIFLFTNVISFNVSTEIAFLFNKGFLVLIPKITDILGIVLSLVLFSAIFSYLPSRYAGKIKPIDALNAVH